MCKVFYKYCLILLRGLIPNFYGKSHLLSFWQFSKPCWQHTNSSNPTGLIAAELPPNKGIRLRLLRRMHSFTTLLLLLPQIGQLNWDHLLANK